MGPLQAIAGSRTPVVAPATSGHAIQRTAVRPARTPLAERRDLDDEETRRALLSLCDRDDSQRRRTRDQYRDLGVEQLGAVYESLLDYQPPVRSTACRCGGRRQKIDRDV